MQSYKTLIFLIIMFNFCLRFWHLLWKVEEDPEEEVVVVGEDPVQQTTANSTAI